MTHDSDRLIPYTVKTATKYQRMYDCDGECGNKVAVEYGGFTYCAACGAECLTDALSDALFATAEGAS